MLVKNRVILQTVAALRRLDGNDKEHYKFSGLTSLTFARNLRRLGEALEEIEKQRRELVFKNKLGQNTDKDGNPAPDKPESVHTFQNEWTEVLEGETEIVIALLKRGQLLLDTNSIPISILAEIDWLLVPEEEAPAPGK